VDPNGDVYVADTNNARVRKLNSDGGLIGKWGSFGSDPGQFRRPTAIAFDPAGNV